MPRKKVGGNFQDERQHIWRVLCYNFAMRPQQTLGWILIVTGLLFLLSGLVITVFASMPTPANQPMAEDAAPTSVWVEFANQLMDFTLQLLALDWTPTRVGVFLIIIGMVLEGAGAYALISPPK